MMIKITRIAAATRKSTEDVSEKIFECDPSAPRTMKGGGNECKIIVPAVPDKVLDWTETLHC